MRRRRFLGAVGAAAVAALAGCSETDQTDSSEVEQPFPIQAVKVDNGDIVLRIVQKQNVDQESGVYSRADRAYLLSPDGTVEGEPTPVLPEQTQVVLTPQSGSGTYIAVLQDTVMDGDGSDEGHVAAAEVQYSGDEAVLVDKWYRTYY